MDNKKDEMKVGNFLQTFAVFDPTVAMAGTQQLAQDANQQTNQQSREGTRATIGRGHGRLAQPGHLLAPVHVTEHTSSEGITSLEPTPAANISRSTFLAPCPRNTILAALPVGYFIECQSTCFSSQNLLPRFRCLAFSLVFEVSSRPRQSSP
jgi:hypothetical protein